jgi:hypothetical protein
MDGIVAMAENRYDSPTRVDHQASISRHRDRHVAVTTVYSHLFDLRQRPEDISTNVLRQADENMFSEIPTDFKPKGARAAIKAKNADVAMRVDNNGAKSAIDWHQSPTRIAPKKLPMSWDKLGAKNNNDNSVSHYAFVNKPTGETPAIYKTDDAENPKLLMRQKKEKHMDAFLEAREPSKRTLKTDFAPKQTTVDKEFVPTCGGDLPKGEKSARVDHRRFGRNHFK